MIPAILQASVLALRAVGTCPAAPVCPTDDKCSQTSNGATLQVNCGVDYFGGDLQRAETTTLAGCINACAATAGCVAASFVSQNCYLKSTLKPGLPNANVVGIIVTNRGASTTPAPTDSTCPASFTCPANNGCTYSDGSRTFKLSCGTDFYGGDIGIQTAESLKACTVACAANAQCVAASFVGGSKPGPCYLKGTKNPGTISDNVNAVSVVPNTTPTPPALSCDAINSASNLVSNPSFETNSGSRGTIDSWTPSNANVYLVEYQPAAKCGSDYIVYNMKTGTDYSLTQKLSKALDSTKSYSLNFYLMPYSKTGSITCTISAYANAVRVFTQDITKFNNEDGKGTGTEDLTYYAYAATFKPAATSVDLKFQATCTGASDAVAYFLLDAVSVTAA
ncbi:hypothetical protein C7974DRAFT_14111 [Boeremia exigua]|uniref:uncharacterized protein n=1 Tax=Boeremia exigua TaxID=749465 RepID=UPI001E8CB24F|nr:uncharacterized protein C7974DRAFT_14111 [Boeremia exigua]KAH6644082.1 hypothetical protein C7974DRAFT_14111 [Boeremia exigua]